MAATALSLMVLITIALLAGAVFLLKRGMYKQRAVLMIVLAIIMILNVALWTVPGSEGETLVNGAPSGPPETDGP